ncbi:MAG: hypothetical protein M5U34_08370 [Chloroflexi bacterium]|nr:hypothetical protein [Chloroflexota bacterium]
MPCHRLPRPRYDVAGEAMGDKVRRLAKVLPHRIAPTSGELGMTGG